MKIRTMLRWIAPTALMRCAFIENDAPDMSGVNKAAETNAELSKEQLEFYKQVYADQAPLRERAADRADEISLAQLDSMRNQDRLANDYDQYRKTTFQPLEREIVEDARAFDSEGERERLAGLAGADVAQSFGAARSQLTRDLGRSGINPSDGRMLSLSRDLAASEALGTSFAKNRARQQAITLASAKKMDAASLGRNLPSNQATSAGIALNAGNAAAGNAQVPISLAQSATNQMGQGYQGAVSANNSAGNLALGAAQVQQRAGDDSALWGAAGQGLGLWAGYKWGR